MKPTPITEEWLLLKAITKVTAREWEIPINEEAQDVIVIKGSRGQYEAFHKIENEMVSRRLFFTDEVEQLYKTLTGKNL
ncbi:MAG TPA: hypothetical protein VFF27_12425 [Bacteroidia bacterium]|jgi:hypothetical protein|nr:hypothetical protein [Bacteroidia bacterium]